MEEKQIKHYCNTHRILLVGEGDFSFSSCLANAFGSAANMWPLPLIHLVMIPFSFSPFDYHLCLSFESYVFSVEPKADFISSNYGRGAAQNIKNLKNNGCKVIHNFDATKMKNHYDISYVRFDRIVFNFPHAGFNKLESRQTQLQRHRNLVKGFFENAKRMLSINGEVHVVDKTNGFFGEWKIEVLGGECGIYVSEKTVFRLGDYPGYETKYGSGGNKNFNCNPGMTFKFRPK